MWFQNFFKSLSSTPTRRRPIRRSPPASRPCFEAMEDRSMPSFLGPVNYAVGLAPQSVVTADFNGGGADIAVANPSSNTVSVLLGDGLGGFGATNDFATLENPRSLVVGDVSGDGKRCRTSSACPASSRQGTQARTPCTKAPNRWRPAISTATASSTWP